LKEPAFYRSSADWASNGMEHNLFLQKCFCVSPPDVAPRRKPRGLPVGRRPERSEGCLAIARQDKVARGCLAIALFFRHPEPQGEGPPIDASLLLGRTK